MGLASLQLMQALTKLRTASIMALTGTVLGAVTVSKRPSLLASILTTPSICNAIHQLHALFMGSRHSRQVLALKGKIKASKKLQFPFFIPLALPLRLAPGRHHLVNRLYCIKREP